MRVRSFCVNLHAPVDPEWANDQKDGTAKECTKCARWALRQSATAEFGRGNREMQMSIKNKIRNYFLHPNEIDYEDSENSRTHTHTHSEHSSVCWRTTLSIWFPCRSFSLFIIRSAAVTIVLLLIFSFFLCGNIFFLSFFSSSLNSLGCRLFMGSEFFFSSSFFFFAIPFICKLCRENVRVYDVVPSTWENYLRKRISSDLCSRICVCVCLVVVSSNYIRWIWILFILKQQSRINWDRRWKNNFTYSVWTTELDERNCIEWITAKIFVDLHTVWVSEKSIFPAD